MRSCEMPCMRKELFAELSAGLEKGQNV